MFKPTLFLLLCFASFGSYGQQIFPPPPERFGQRQRFRPDMMGQNGPGSGNSLLSRAYGNTWFRDNFQDLFSYRGAQKLEWFEVLEGNDCTTIPAVVNAGRPPRDICRQAAVDERRCICINTGRSESESGYEQICGDCRDPCQLKFTPDRVPGFVRQLAAEREDDTF